MPASAAQLPAAGLRLLMMGTGPFAVPTFEALLESPHQLTALVTRPDRPTHRREKSPHNPMREVALKHNLEVFEPESINSAEAHLWLAQQRADLFVVCDYGQILSQQSLQLARLGGINLHASLLPRYRGAAPINWAIYQGETETGVTVIHMTPQLDGGPSLVQLRTAIGPDETAPQVEMRLATLGVQAVLDAVGKLQQNDHPGGIVQDQSQATKAPRLKKETGRVDWSRSAAEIYNQFRALQPWPTTYTFWTPTVGGPIRLILQQILPTTAVPDKTPPPGTVLPTQTNELIVVCGSGSLRIEQIQPAGKRIMTAGEFLRGHPQIIGKQLT